MGLVLAQMKKKWIFLVIIVALLIPQQATGTQFVCPPTYLRIELGLNLASAEFAQTEGSYELVDYITQRVISSDVGTGTWFVAPAGSVNIQISNNGQPVQGLGSAILILRQKNYEQQNIFRFKNKRYRGDLLIQNLNGQIHIINVIDVEQYLYGVVGAEIGMAAPDEALKAQAIVSRTYALYYKQHPQLNYDLGTTTQFQVYSGYDMEVLSGSRVKKAVDDTRGLVIYYDNQVIQAFFHSNSGGYTESCENVWYANIPYLQPVAAPEDSHALEVSQQQDWPAVTYQWQKTFTKQELKDQLSNWNKNYPNDLINVGEVLDLTATRLAINPVTKEFTNFETASKRVTQLNIVGSKGTKSFFKDRIRTVLGLRSTLFEIYMDSTVKIWNAFGTTQSFNQTKNLMAINTYGMVSKLNGDNGNYYIVTAEGTKTVPKSFSNITIAGKGYGHGLGMSQWGARGMASKGSNFQQIIYHYYNQNRNDGRIQIKMYEPVIK